MIDLSCSFVSTSIGVAVVEIGFVALEGSSFVPEVVVSVGGTDVRANSNCSLVMFRSSAGALVGFSCCSTASGIDVSVGYYKEIEKCAKMSYYKFCFTWCDGCFIVG